MISFIIAQTIVFGYNKKRIILTLKNKSGTGCRKEEKDGKMDAGNVSAEPSSL